jgi:NADPH-dependent ferric siderophore reductase
MAEDIPGFRPYKVTVRSVTRLSPHYARIVFAGEQLGRLGTDGFDQRIKILLPLPDGRWGDPHLFDEESVAQGLWYQQWKALGNDDRNPVRTYTIRKAAPDRRELTVDFVIHSDAGPAGLFASSATVGDEAVIIGPDAYSIHSAIGIDFHPGPSRHLLLIGDETATPAIAAILEQLADAEWRGSGIAITEVECIDDILPQRIPDHFRLYQRSRAQSSIASTREIPRGERIMERLRTLAASGEVSSAPDHARTLLSDEEIVEVEDLDSDADFLWEVPAQAPDDGLYAWVAGEASMVRSIRRFLIAELGLDRKRIAFMGYWREGRKEI